jgi:pilus assembly protein Flp/PilA
VDGNKPSTSLKTENTEMDNMIVKIRNFLKDEDGLTTVEYAVAGSLISLTVLLSFTALGDQVENTIDFITTTITSTP